MLLTLTLVSQGAVARVHVTATMPMQMSTHAMAAEPSAAMAPEMTETDCHQPATAKMPCHDATRLCDGECGQCSVIHLPLAAMLTPTFALPLQHHAQPFAALLQPYPLYLWGDTPPPTA
ncbi:hypothetical protein [uncultured Ferrimonas sp.]|uniref:hypothetical protein n=1 Tax=uncultured Ferrimonas sp. TaxID=432640 RepID=UPI0026226EA7|nr:hypothetical protein [uncultured Ferrimonas sp.]